MKLHKPGHLLMFCGLFVWLGGITQIMAAPEDNNRISSSTAGKAPAQYKARASFEKAKYFLGENAMLNFSIENTSRDPITLDTGGDYRGTVRATRFQVKAVAEDGSIAPDPHPDAALYCQGGLGGGQKLNPSQRASFSVSLGLYARIEKPGKYKVSVSHDFGWGLAEGKRPTGTTEVEFVAPSCAEARKLVEEIYKEEQMKAVAGRDDAYDDVRSLSYPVYLQPLLDKIGHGNSREAESAVKGIGGIAGVDATKALLNIAGGNNKKLALLASRELAMRLPDPELKGDLPRRNIFEVSYDPERTHLVKTSWQDSFAPAVRELGKKLLNSADKEEQPLGAFMLQCVGDASSSKSVVSALDAAIKKSKTLPFESYVYPRPRGNVAELIRTASVLADRGNVSENPQSPGECALYMTLFSKDAKFRPADWQKRYLGFFKNEIPYMRELALKTVPTPVPPTFISEIARLLKDPDVDVQIAACQLTEKVKEGTFKVDLRYVLANAKEQWLINAASNALAKLDRVEYLRTLASKFDDPSLTQNALGQFIPGIVQVQSWGSRCGLVAGGDDDMAVAGKRMKTLWLNFIKDNEAFLRGGGMVKAGDPRITADYLPHSMSLGQVNGKDWPPLKTVNSSTTNFQDKAVQDRLMQQVKRALPPKWQIKSRGTGLPDGWICSSKSPCFRVTISDGKSDKAIWYVPANWIAIRKANGNNIPGGEWDCINGNAALKAMCQQAEYKFLSDNFRRMLTDSRTTSLINSGFDLSKQIFAGKEQEADQKALQLVNENCKSAEGLNAAAISLIELGVPAKQVFLKAARQGTGDTTELIEALRLVGGKDAADVLLKMLGDPGSSDLVRARSAQALGDMGSLNNAVPLLTKAMQVTRSEESLSDLAKALASTGSPQAGKTILDTFNRVQNPWFKIELGDLLAGMHYKEASSALQKLEREINSSRDGNLSGGTHFNVGQLQEMRKRIKFALRQLAEPE
jgi:hypothetical protein